MLQKRIKKEELLPVTSLREYSSYLQQTLVRRSSKFFNVCEITSGPDRALYLLSETARAEKLISFHISARLFCIFLQTLTLQVL